MRQLGPHNNRSREPSVSLETNVSVRFYPPPEDLRRYFTTFYVADIDPGTRERLSDCLHPEWAGLRFFTPDGPIASISGGPTIENMRFLGTGPTSLPVHFSMPKSRLWGIGFLPLGWAQFVRQPAGTHANLICDGFVHPSFAPFVPLAQQVFNHHADEAAVLATMVTFFRNLKPLPLPDERRIQAIHEALVDPQLVTVAELVERVAASQRTVERLCHRHFGFSPKVLLRRQRLMRSMVQFMIDPSLKWIGAMDSHYHDQAQFVRDFRYFMGMSPREYSSASHPVLDRFVQERNRVYGSAVQTMDRPVGMSAGAV